MVMVEGDSGRRWLWWWERDGVVSVGEGDDIKNKSVSWEWDGKNK